MTPGDISPHRRSEIERLQSLKAFEILDTPAEAMFDRFTEIAAAICRTPIATISLIDENRQWYKSKLGLDLCETARVVAFCDSTVRHKKMLVVEDARKHPEFRNNPLVTGPPHLRFYAGFPLITVDGHAIGALAVMDHEPRRLSTVKLALLKLLADQVMTQLELRRQRGEVERESEARRCLNAQLQRQSEHLRDAQRIAHVGSWEMELPSRQLLLSEETFRIFGVPFRDEPVDYRNFLTSVHVEDRARLEAALGAALEGKGALDIVHRIVRPGGEIRYVHQSAALAEGLLPGRPFAGTVRDITDEHRAREKLELLHTCVDRVADIVMITEGQPYDEPGPRIVFVNRAFEERTGYAVHEVLGRSPRLLQGKNTQRSELDKVRRALERKEQVKVELINYRKDGSEFWIEIDIAPVFEDGEVKHFVAVQRDISQRKATEQRIEQLAFFDPLTNLPNRRLLTDRLHHAILTIERRECCGALLYLDLDNFKSINDTLGHEKGDSLLIQVGERLQRTIRSSNTVARIGGDEFVVLLEDLSQDGLTAAAQAEHVAEKILACFHAPFQIGGNDYVCTTSVGVITFCGNDKDGDELLKRADVAMYEAKAAGRNSARFFDHSMQVLVDRRVALERELRNSLRRGDFVLHYQPQIDANGELVGAEALVRWQHPERGLLYPDAFIALAEETRLILPLGQWVLESACRNLAALERENGMEPPRIAVNVSAQQFHHPEFVTNSLRAFEEAGIDPRHIKLELSESVLIENFESTAEKMQALKRRGVRFSLDDFGTGYSSLAYLKRLPVDEIKIDQAFVRDILDNPDDAVIVRTIISLAQSLGFEVVAEGVETASQHALLAQLGCTVCQGYLFSQPLPAPELFGTNGRRRPANGTPNRNSAIS